jgi:hypothetical protein
MVTALAYHKHQSFQRSVSWGEEAEMGVMSLKWNEILPAHHFTLWQPLQKCTQSDLNFHDWTIQADNPHTAIHTMLQI